MRWFRREPKQPVITYRCFACGDIAHVPADQAEALAPIARQHEAHHAPRSDKPNADITTPSDQELLTAIRRAIRKNGGGDVGKALA